MTDLVVVRGAGDRPGPDIVDPLMSENRIALVRGRVELDESEPADELRLTVPFQDVRLGQTLQCRDFTYGVWAAKVTGVLHRASMDDQGNLSAETVITVRRPHCGNPSCTR